MNIGHFYCFKTNIDCKIAYFIFNNTFNIDYIITLKKKLMIWSDCTQLYYIVLYVTIMEDLKCVLKNSLFVRLGVLILREIFYTNWEKNVFADNSTLSWHSPFFTVTSITRLIVTNYFSDM